MLTTSSPDILGKERMAQSVWNSRAACRRVHFGESAVACSQYGFNVFAR